LEPESVYESAQRLEPETYEHYFSGLRRQYAPALAIAVFLAGDFLALCASIFLGFAFASLLHGSWLSPQGLEIEWPFLVLFGAGFAFIGLYPGLSLAPSEELRRFAVVSFFGFLAMTAMDLAHTDAWGWQDWSSVMGFVFSVPILTAGRVFTRSRCARSRWWGVPVVIFGAGETGRELVDRLRSYPWIGYRPAVMLDDDSASEGWYKNVPIFHGSYRGPEIARTTGITTAIVAMQGVTSSRVSEIVERYTRPFRQIILIPDLVGMTSLWMNVRDFEGYLGLSMSQRLMYKRNQAQKRIIELGIVFAASIVLSPVFLLIALAIKLDSPGGVFYGHQRLGRCEKEFIAWKFRTMRVDADRILEDHLAGNEKAREEWEKTRKLKDDPRITRVGRFLRASSLDELPQFWNVWKGQMSLIGPRPIVREEILKYGNSWSLISSVKPGATGLWQVSGRSDTSYQERVELDLYYLRNWSLWLDLYILFKTIWTIVSAKGAY